MWRHVAIFSSLLLSLSLFPTPTLAKETFYVAFTEAHQRPDVLLMQTIDRAKRSLDIAIYSITNEDIVASILKAKERGVKVRLITDASASHFAPQQRMLALLLRAGIPIKENRPKTGLMHLKLTIVDDQWVAWGSYNYSWSASTINDEMLTVLQDPLFAQQCTHEFNRLWTSTSFMAYHA